MDIKTLKIGLFIFTVSSFTFVKAQEKQDSKEVRFQKIFKQYDADANGTISLSEFKAQSANKEVTKVKSEKYFAGIDTDNNGALDLNEFKAAVEKQPKLKRKVIDVSKITKE